MISKAHQMTMRMVWLLVACILCMPALAPAAEINDYSKTIDELAQLYERGLSAWQHYQAYEIQAKKENLDEMARLFAAMAASQSVMTGHFHRLLVDLKGDRKRCMPQSRTVGITQDNLRAAIEMELRETDVSFPNALRQITSEGHRQAIRALQIAIEVQRHHREKLKKIHSYSGYFFGALTAKFSRHQPKYFICRQTGVVVLDKLPSNCPVQGGTTSSYIELVAFETDNGMMTCSPNNHI
ncbi:ferritin family protein [Desulfosarcina sp.]|uniref:ferritin family protein n=1 Tax=Desulfosarcina sp. TaxID=2027861 RepID=UPI0029BD069F|nr:ferritin family protein [Desulfosarcina sp.]MDX2454217.1 ferritin family protein [Desulfosarcina sp.]MDX2491889.1 ferritin family protein [Desulfosarcina sp.]